MTIPISQVVQVLPGVIGAGGTPSRLSGLVVSQDNSLAPSQAPKQFFTAADVSSWFGPNAPETTIANNYFPGTVNAGQLPYVLKFMGYALTASPAGSYGAQLGNMTLAQLQALSGSLTFTINGLQFSSSSISLAGATSFSNAAAIMNGAFAPSAPGVNGALSFTSGGSLNATNYYVKSTWVNAQGESLPAPETSLAIALGNVLRVAAPSGAPAGATGWNVYVGRSSGSETLQNTTPIAVGVQWQEDNSGLYFGGTGMSVAASSNGALSQTPSGSLAGATYYVRVSFNNSQGETLTVQTETSFAVSANNVLVAGAPATVPVGATSWNIYVGTTAGQLVKQNTAPIALGSPWTMPATGLIGAGNVSPPTDTVPGTTPIPSNPGSTSFYMKSTWVTASGESMPSAGASITPGPANTGPTYPAPTGAPAGATGWNLYAFSTVAGGGYVKQNAAPLAIGTAWSSATVGSIVLGPTLQTPPTPTTVQPFNVTYDVQRGRFLLQTTATGPAQTSSDIGGTLAPGVKLASSAGAYIATVGLAADTPASVMARAVALDTNWGVFSTSYAANITDRLAYAAWNSGQAYQYVYLGWDTDAASIVANNAASFGAQVVAQPYQGTWPVYGTQALAGALMGYVAGVNFSVPNGRATAAFRQFNSAPTATATDLATANALLTNSYTYLGSYANQANSYTVSYAGSISGSFLWVDTYIDQVYMNRELQRALWEGLLAYNSIPYNQDGYTALYNNALPVIQQAVSSGIIRSGVTLSASQAQQVNTQAGRQISDVLQTRGWYLLIGDPTNVAQVRAARQSPTAYLWYTDGGSIQQITIRSIAVI